MIQGALGIIDKMRIEVYSSLKYHVSDFLKTIYVQINPSEYTTETKVDFCEEQAMGSTSQNLKFNKIGSDQVSFTFYFDSSGVVPPAKITKSKAKNLPVGERILDALEPASAIPFQQAMTIEEELEEFKKCLSGYDGDKHEPRYLKLLWGGFEMDCRLTSLSIKYSMFRKDGRPIRAVATCAFKGTQSYKTMQAKQNKQSPDITHKRILKQDDAFLLMAERIYNEKQYYIDVAKANGLLSFRKLEVGQDLIFPPLK